MREDPLPDQTQRNVTIAVVRPAAVTDEKVTVEVHPYPFPFAVMAGSSGAVYGSDYTSPNGRTFELDFPPNVTRRTFSIDMVDDDLVEFNEDFVIRLSPNNRRGNFYETSVTILYDEAPAGAIDRAWNPDAVSSQNPPGNPNPGANGIVQAVAIQDDGRAVIGGQFTAYDTVPRNFLTRISANGLLDSSFMASPNTGPNSVVNAITLYSTSFPNHTGKLLIGGGFTSYNGILRRGVARLLSNGALDSTFNPGNGVDGIVYALALQNDGKVLIGGDFLSVNGIFQPHLARLNDDGTLDTSFKPVVDWPVYALALDSNQRILAGGDFYVINDLVRPGIVRLTAAGQVDETFDPRGGADFTVYALTVQPDNRVLLGGAFTSVDFRSRQGIARLNVDGSLDESFNPGIGANDTVNTIVLQADGRIFVGGAFTTFNFTRRKGLTRLYADGTVDTTFLDAAYNQFAGFINEFSYQPNNFVNGIGIEASGDLIVGGRFQQVGGNYRDPIYTRADKRIRSNVARILGGGTGGPGNVGFRDPTYTVDENGSQLRVTITRNNGGLGNLVAAASTGANTATPGEDYTEVTDKTVRDGNTSFVIPILDDQIPEGNETANLTMYEPYASLYLIGENIGINGALHRALASMMIVDNDFLPGRFRYSTANFSTNENGRFAVITVERIGGSDGSVSVDYFTANGTASSADYTGASGTLFFAPGQTTRTFTVRLFDDILVEDEESVFLSLTNATGGAAVDFSSVDPTFNPGLGADGTVFATAIYTNQSARGKVAVGGSFTTFNGADHANLVRLNPDGTVDADFSSVATANGPVRATATQSDGRLLIGGEFTQVNGTGANRLARLTSTGDLDTSGFDFGDGPDNTVRAIVVQTNGYILVGGDFTAWSDDANHGYLVRLGPDGAVDTSFQASLDGPVRAIALQEGGQIVIGGDFAGGVARLATDGSEIWFSNALLSNASVHSVAALGDGTILAGGKYIAPGDSPHFVRLNRFGNLDSSFNIGTGPNGPVYAIAVHSVGIYAGSVMIGGAFTAVNGSPRNRLARFQPDDLLDEAVSLVPGPNGNVKTLAIQNDNKVIFGGDFSQIDYQSRLHLARLSPAASVLTIVDDDFSAGRVSFTSLGYTTNENAGAALIAVKRSGGNVGYLTVEASATAGTAEAGVDFVAVTNTLVWNNGDSEVKYLVVPLINDTEAEPLESVILMLDNPSLAGALGTISNSVLTIENDDYPGFLQFSAAAYGVVESSGSAVITVTRAGGTAGPASVVFATSAGTAVAGTHYYDTNGVLDFADGESSKAFRVTIVDDTTGNPNRTVNLTLSDVTGAELGAPAAAVLTIIDNESENSPAGSVDTTFDTQAGANASVYAVAVQPDGRILLAGDFTQVNNITRSRIARLNDIGDLDTTFNINGGPDASVRALALQDDGKILIGGFFTSIGGVNRGHLARLNTDATVDNSFDPGGGADGAVNALALTPEGKVILGGAFTRVNGITLPNVAMVDANGHVAADFNPGVGPDDTVFALALQSNGKVLLGGDFQTVNNAPRRYLARLNRDGSVDSSFDVGTALNGTVRSVLVQSDGKILVGGSFTSVQGSSRNYVARFNADGTLDTTFLAGQTGGNNAVYGMALQVDEKILVVGEFSQFNGVTRNRITRLNQDGTSDATINFGTGANAFVTSVTPDSLNRIVIGGGFTQVNGKPRVRIARLYGGAMTGSGRLEFSAANFNINEFVTNAVISVRRVGGTDGQVSVRQTSSAGTATPGADYVNVTNVITFPPGEVLRTFTLPVIDDAVPEDPETVNLSLDSPQGATLGPQPVAIATIISDDSVITFDRASYREPENTISGRATLTVLRQFATNSVVAVSYYTSTNFPVTTVRRAEPNVDFTPTNGVLVFQVGETQKNVFVPLLDNFFPDGNRALSVQLTNPIATLPSRTAILGTNRQGILTIVDNEIAEGRFRLSASEYEVTEGNVDFVVTVQRVNGSSGIVSVNYRTTGGTAQAGVDYESVNGTLAFADGENINRFVVPIFDDAVWEENETILLQLENPTGGATMSSPTNAVLTLLDNEPPPALLTYFTNAVEVDEFRPYATVQVLRSFNTNGTTTVDYYTVDGLALAGQDYEGTNGTLTFAPGETGRAISVPLLNNSLVQPKHEFYIVLTNASDNALIQPPGIATVTIIDYDANVGFSSANYSVNEFGFLANITLIRTGVSNRLLSVDYAALPGTATTNLDFYPTNGTVIFGFGQTTQSFSVQIRDDFLDEGNETVLLVLSNLVGEGTLGRSNATLTIIDDDDHPGHVVFQPVDYLVAEGSANVSVRLARTNGFSGEVTVHYITTPGTATPGLDYIPETDNLITFEDGETNKVIVIPILEDNNVEGNEDFLVTLFDPAGGVILPGPTTATVVIEDNDFQSGSLDDTFVPVEGANDAVRALAVQADGRVLVGGAFTQMDGVPHDYVARLMADGTLDTNFLAPYYVTNVVGWVTNYLTNEFTLEVSVVVTNDQSLVTNLVAQGTDGVVSALGVPPDSNKIVLGGAFTMINGTNRNHIARLLSDGSVDSIFYKSNTLNAALTAIWPLPGGKTLAGGGFSRPVAGIMRFLNNAAEDTSLDPGAGANGVVNAVAKNPEDNRLVIGGDFTTVNLLPRSRVARLYDYGGLDDQFTPPTITTGAVFAVLVQSDNKVIIGGDFTWWAGSAALESHA